MSGRTGKKRMVYVSPPESCNICNESFNGVMYDARIPIAGSWANLCRRCFDRFGCEFGTGRGQKYVLCAGKFVKEG